MVVQNKDFKYRFRINNLDDLDRGNFKSMNILKNKNRKVTIFILIILSVFVQKIAAFPFKELNSTIGIDIEYSNIYIYIYI